MAKKRDTEELKSMLDGFDFDVAEQVLRKYLADNVKGAFKKREDFPQPESLEGAAVPESVGDLGYIERIIDESNLLPVAFLDEGSLRQKAVARLPKSDPYNPLGRPWGTGFLVSNSLIMTNNHVMGSVGEAKQILVQFNYQVDFNGMAQAIDTWSLDPDDFFYTNASLDFTLVRVKGKKFLYRLPIMASDLSSEADLLSVAPSLATRVDPARRFYYLSYPGWKWGFLQLSAGISTAQDRFVNIVQHPAGRMKEVALQKNQVTHVYSDRIHYTTDTEPGSSGSPVFDNQWDLIALHHAAGHWDSNAGKWIDNEGMRIDSIVADIRNQYSSSNPALLQELGI